MRRQFVATFVGVAVVLAGHAQGTTFTIASPSVPSTLSTASDDDSKITISGQYTGSTSGQWVTLWEDINPWGEDWVKETYSTSSDVCDLEPYPGMPTAGTWYAYVHNDGGAAGWQHSPVYMFPYPHTRANYMIQIGDHDDDGYDQKFWYFMN